MFEYCVQEMEQYIGLCKSNMQLVTSLTTGVAGATLDPVITIENYKGKEKTFNVRVANEYQKALEHIG